MNEQQLAILQQQNIVISHQLDVLSGRPIEELSIEELVEFATICNLLYRAGVPIVEDAFYDKVIIPRMIALDPNHPYLHQVEPEPILGKTVPLPQIMLSTNKAYAEPEIKTWLTTLQVVAIREGLSPDDIEIRITPKLDGYAAYDDSRLLYTRGDGYKGTDITYVFDRGVQVIGDRGLGPGELVISKSYFHEQLSQEYENSRNFQGAVLREQQLSPSVERACHDGAIVFYPFSELPSWEGVISELLKDFDFIIDSIWNSVDYEVDGVVLEATDPVIKEAMGHTSHHHRWQIAFKRNEQAVEVGVIRVIGQTGKSGRITPVAELVPTRISGALVSRATAHNYGHVLKWSLGAGSVVEVVRSGLVIPKILGPVKPGEVIVPTQCPSCGAPTAWENDHLYCSNLVSCPAQLEARLQYFFHTLGNCDGFGPKTIEVLCQHGVRSVSEIYSLTKDRFQAMGFGTRQSENLVRELLKSRRVEIEDWRFLAAFGIPNIGKGGCELLLRHYKLLDVFRLTREQILAIHGFSDKSADTLVSVLKDIKPEFDYLFGTGFNLRFTPIGEAAVIQSPIAGKALVFTGTMSPIKREHLEKHAKSLGARVGSSVTGKTDYLIVGDEPGASKLSAAEIHHTPILTAEEYQNLINRK